jgi:putative FmdB family regulatory protein
VPTYQYACTECGDRSEVAQRFTDDPLTVCSTCGGKLRKIFSPVGIVFKGSGFYRTDSRASSSTVSAGKEASASNGSSKAGSESKSGSSGDSGSGSSSDSGSSSGGSASSGEKSSGEKSGGEKKKSSPVSTTS